MRVYYVHLQRSDFSLTTIQWTSPVVDLYQNSTYTNYSVVKSSYGLGAVQPVLGTTPNNTWVGMEFTGPTTTDTGIISNGRYIDTSGAINLVSYTIVTQGYVGNSTLDLYTSISPNAIFPLEWVPSIGIRQSDGIGLTNQSRYARFVLNFDSDPGSVDFYVRVEIGGPVMVPKYGATRQLLEQFPSWMSMHEVEEEIPAAPQLSRTTSLGGSFLNAMAGEWVDDLSFQINYRYLQQFIDTVDINQKAWCSKCHNLPRYPYAFVGDGIFCTVAMDLNEFYNSDPSDDVIFWDEQANAVYVNRPYHVFTVNGIAHSLESHHIWTSLDNIGAIVNLYRLPMEGNASYQTRVRDVYINPQGAGAQSFKNAIRRELNLWALYGSTPDSSFVGATPMVLEMADIEKDPGYVDPDGMPTTRFNRLVEYLAKTYPVTWGRFVWGKSFWDIGGLNHEGFAVLPNRMDATPTLDVDTQPGVGDQDDLLLYSPTIITGPRSFQSELTVLGKQRSPQTQYPPVTVDFTVQGTATRPIYNNPASDVWFTLEFKVFGDSTTYFTTFLMSSTSDVDVYRPVASAASYATMKVFDSDGATHVGMYLQNKVDGNYLGRRLLLQNIAQVQLRVGQWDVLTQTYLLRPGSDTFTAWFSINPTSNIKWNSDTGATPVILTLTGLNSATPTSPFSVVMSSKQTFFSNLTWTSDITAYEIVINNSTTTTSQQPVTLTVPNINWDPYINPATEQLIFTLTQPPTVQAYDGSQIVLTNSYIKLNGSNSWSGGGTITTVPQSSVVFSAGSGGLYPTTGYIWSLYQPGTTVTYTGTVDENGPWRGNIPSDTGNTNYLFRTIQLGRTDFGVPHTADYQITWIGATEVGGYPQVVSWTSTNSVVETNYEFQPLGLNVRITPDPAPQWNPQIHAGTFFEGTDEYYLYAQPEAETFTGPTAVLSNLATQGAPIIVWTNEATPRPLREVCFFNWDVDTPALSITNVETLVGNGTSNLYASYNNLYNISVSDISNPLAPILLPSTTTTNTNVITLFANTTTTSSYQVSYKLANSFYVDQGYLLNGATPRTKITTDSNLSYLATYEASVFNPAVPLDLALSPFYTTISEGFIFLSHKEYPLNFVLVHLSPTRLMADGLDYMVITLRSVDQFGNPKANQPFTLTTNYGVFDDNLITTSRDGFGIATMTAPNVATTIPAAGLITITGPSLNTTVSFSIDRPTVSPYRILALPSQAEIRANLRDMNLVYGMVQNGSFAPVPGVPVIWHKARSLHDLWAGPATPLSGTVTTAGDGTFTVGPFTSSTPAGYWFMSLDTAAATPATVPPAPGGGRVGDVVYWYEAPDYSQGVGSITGIPIPAIQMATPISAITSYMATPFQLSYYDELAGYATPGSTPNWLPPPWFPLPAYDQFQLGCLPPGFRTGALPPRFPGSNLEVGSLPSHPYQGTF